MATTEPQNLNEPARQPATARQLGYLRKALFASVVGLAMTCAATVGSAVAHPAATPSSASTVIVHPVVANDVLALLNHERALNHLPALSMNTDLINSAYSHNAAMAHYDLLSHQCPHEKSLGDRILAAHYNWSTAAENIGWTSAISTQGAEALETIMYDEKAPNDGHRLNILSSSYRDIGISIITDTTHNRLWLTEDFGHLM